EIAARLSLHCDPGVEVDCEVFSSEPWLFMLVQLFDERIKRFFEFGKIVRGGVRQRFCCERSHFSESRPFRLGLTVISGFRFGSRAADTKERLPISEGEFLETRVAAAGLPQ